MTRVLGQYHFGEFIAEARVTHYGTSDNLTYRIEWLPDKVFTYTLIGASQPRASHGRELMRQLWSQVREHYEIT
jgi:hypothetical protein